MNGKLYFNKSDKRYVNKTLEAVTYEIEGVTHDTVYIEFIDDSSVTDPTLKMTAFTGGLKANYLWLEDLHRYYYIEDWTLSKGYIYLKCHVDVLMTYKDEIMRENVILDRQENKNNVNLYQDDPEFKIYNYTNIVTRNFRNGFSESVSAFLLTVVGKTTSSNNGGDNE